MFKRGSKWLALEFSENLTIIHWAWAKIIFFWKSLELTASLNNTRGVLRTCQISKIKGVASKIYIFTLNDSYKMFDRVLNTCVNYKVLTKIYPLSSRLLVPFFIFSSLSILSSLLSAFLSILPISLSPTIFYYYREVCEIWFLNKTFLNSFYHAFTIIIFVS